MKQLVLKKFLELYTIDDIRRATDGEVNETSIEDYTIFYGNSELTIMNDNDEFHYSVNNARGFYELVAD